jgi:uncharacterized membrane protein YdfJ with MMPL/SSD domain
MHPLETSRHFAARMGRWSARHWKLATFGWLVFTLGVFVVGGAIGIRPLSDADGMNGDSARAQRMIHVAGFHAGAAEAVLVQAARNTTAQELRRAVDDAVNAIKASGRATRLRSPYGRGNGGRLSRDGRSALIEFDVHARPGEAHDGVEHVLRALRAVRSAHPRVRIEEAGDASFDKAVDDTVGKDLRRAELFSIPLTLAILIVACGALVAAVIPVVLALTAFIAALGIAAFSSRLVGMDDAASSVMLLIGLAVGVDYSLFYLKREREERALGRTPTAALEAAAATSGRSVLVSGLTVIVAVSGMFLAGSKTFEGIGLATITVVAVAVVGSLTVLPALLSRLGDNVGRGRVPLLDRLGRDGGPRVWAAIVNRVLRHPRLAAALAAGALLALAAPAVVLHTAIPGADDLPQQLTIVQTVQRIQRAFPGSPSPARVAVRGVDVTAPPVRAALHRLRTEAVVMGIAHEPITETVNPAKTVAVVSVPLEGNGAGDARSEASLARLRAAVRTLVLPAVQEAAVGGDIAASRDFNGALKSHMPAVIAFVLSLAFVLLLACFRSLTLALTAIALNLLSVGAAYGLLVIVFQHGVGESVLGFTSTGSIISWLPLFLFVVLFGLSMDYHVFIISRIREAHDRGLETRAAIATGVESSAGVVTAAATVMVFVFAIFATLSRVSLKELGVGLAAAVLIDATVVRAVLLPAVMALLGEGNWYLPRRLSWLPRASAHEADSRSLEPSFKTAR